MEACSVRHSASFLLERAEFLVARLIGCHYIRERLPLLALFDQVRKRLVDERLKLSPLALRDIAQRRQKLGIDLGREFHSSRCH